MVDPFAMAAAALFSAPGSAAATYSPIAGDDVPCRAIITVAPVDLIVGNRQIEAGATLIQLQRADFLQAGLIPQRGGTVVADGVTYSLIADPRLDVERTAWTCEAVEV